MDREEEICPVDQSRLRTIVGICKAAQLAERTEQLRKAKENHWRVKRLAARKKESKNRMKNATILAQLKRDSR
jgi:hypothetical protein